MIGIKILVVEDSYEHQCILTACLSAAGYGIVLAGDGEDALQCLHLHPDIDLIVLDLKMPRMDGITFRRLQMADPRFKHLPVILYSSEPTLATIAEDLRVTRIASKLDELGVLLRHVNQVMADKRDAAGVQGHHVALLPTRSMRRQGS